MSLHLKLLDIDHPLSFEESKLRQIDAHALIYLSPIARNVLNAKAQVSCFSPLCLWIDLIASITSRT